MPFAEFLLVGPSWIARNCAVRHAVSSRSLETGRWKRCRSLTSVSRSADRSRLSPDHRWPRVLGHRTGGRRRRPIMPSRRIAPRRPRQARDQRPDVSGLLRYWSGGQYVESSPTSLINVLNPFLRVARKLEKTPARSLIALGDAPSRAACSHDEVTRGPVCPQAWKVKSSLPRPLRCICAASPAREPVRPQHRPRTRRPLAADCARSRSLAERTFRWLAISPSNCPPGPPPRSLSVIRYVRRGRSMNAISPPQKERAWRRSSASHRASAHPTAARPQLASLPVTLRLPADHQSP